MNPELTPSLESQEFFTVYLTELGLELYPGCCDRGNSQAIHTSKSYHMAVEFAQTAASIRQVPFKNRVKGIRSCTASEQQSPAFQSLLL